MEADLCLGFSKSDWERLTERLDRNEESDWQRAIGVFERRMKERFFSSIDALFAADTRPEQQSSDPTQVDHCVPGFSIMALCCLLIETLQKFRQPGPRTHTRDRFLQFLRRPAFDGAFDDNNVAKLFYKGIRNAILHEAETERWVIWRDTPAGQIVARKANGFVLNRTLFYRALEQEFTSYLHELRDPRSKELRRRFRRQMNNIVKNT